jgi:hypothetical protein
MKKSADKSLSILKILITIAAVLYIIFLIFESVPLFNGSGFADISVYLLFILFAAGYYFVWKNELISGIILVAWHIFQWILVFWVWVDGGLTLVLGLPIGIMGIIVLVHGIRKANTSNNN